METSPPQTAQPAGRSFPLPGKNLYRMINDPDFRKSFHAQLKRWNPFVVFFYRIGLLTLFGASRTVMILSTRGWKSGRRRSTPIGYFPVGGIIHIFSAWGASSAWHKNVCAHPEDVRIQIGLRRRKVRVEFLEDRAEIQSTLEQFIRESPRAANELFGWDDQTDRIESSDFSAIHQYVLIVRMI